MARRKRKLPFNPSVTPIFIGNCKVEIDGSASTCREHDHVDSVTFTFSSTGRIKISANHSGESAQPEYCNEEKSSIDPENFSILLVKPKDIGSENEFLLQNLLKLYGNELPSMKFAANTGKKSRFLERCISNGRYRTLILVPSPLNMLREVIAAISFQIIPADTQYAEIPLAAVKFTHQNKGFGQFLFEELRRRLQHVGVSTILCWADEQSEGFWLKQDFTSLGNINRKGRHRRLPIKAEIWRSLCFPGGATLMVAHLCKSPVDVSFGNEKKGIQKFCYAKPALEMKELCDVFQDNSDKAGELVPLMISDEGNRSHEKFVVSPGAAGLKNTTLSEDLQSHIGLTDKKGVEKILKSECKHCSGSETCPTNEYRDPSLYFCCVKQCPTKRLWESSVSSLKSKRVRGSQCGQCNLEAEFSCIPNKDRINHDNLNIMFGGGTMIQTVPNISLVNSSTENICSSVPNTNTKIAQSVHVLEDKGVFPRVMFMDIADGAKKMNLAKIVENLGGSVTASGCICTHVISPKARPTLNFCMALCSGALVVSSNWLKESYKAGKFLDGLQFLLEDVDYALKYKSSLKQAVLNSKARPNALLEGYQICIRKRTRPPPGILSQIILSAGGTIILNLKDLREPTKTIFLAAEEDMEDAFAAAKEGVWTYNSDWLINCIMKQELDFEAPQFAESL